VAPAERLDFRLCGGLRVSCGGEKIPLKTTARQGRLALAYLVIHHDQAVTRDELISSFGADLDPRRVSTSLSQTLSRLRHVLGPDRLEKLPAGAVCLHGPLRVDIEVADRALTEGRLALAAEDWEEASRDAQAGLGELTGKVLANDEAEWLEEVRGDVHDLEIELIELRAGAALGLGEWAEAQKAARAVIAADRKRESAWALLIRAQAGQGDAALASQTFHELKTLLMEECGLMPSRELIALHDRLVEGGLTRRGRSSGSVAFPPALSLESGDDAFVGRDDVLALLRTHYAKAKDGDRQFVLLSGEPGIGKTRLASEFARDAHADGATVLYGRSDAETLVPYQPFVTAIDHYVGECGDALAEELDDDLSELSRLIPSIARTLPALREPLAVEPEMRRFRLFNAVARVLAFIARDRPAVLVLDDLQWADASTALLLRHTVREVGHVRLLLLGTLRDVEECASEQLADLIARPRPGLERIRLHGLDADEIAELVHARQGRDASERAVGVLQKATGGNPLLLEETLKVLAESDTSGNGLSERAVRDVGLPEGAKHVIGRRLERLSGTAQRVLADASVVGAEFGVRLVEIVSEVPAKHVIPALEDAEAAGLVREVPDAGDRYSFSHALVREVLLDGQSTARRRRLHHEIGEALEATGDPSAAELAHHFTESQDPADADRALEYSLAAGAEAKRQLAYEDAAGHFRRALRLLALGDEARRCEVLLELGGVELRQGSPDAKTTFQHAFDLAERNGLAALQADAALGFASRYTEVGVVDRQGIALLRAARDAVGTSDPALQARLSAALADNLHFAPEPGEAMRLSGEALQLAPGDDAHARAVALESRHSALLSIEHLDERLELSQQLIDLAQDERDRELEALGRHWRIYDLLEAAEMTEAARERELLDTLARELRQPLYLHFAAGWDVVWAQLAGKVDEVEPHARRFRELGIEAQARDTETIYLAQLQALRRRQERHHEFISAVQAAVEANPTLLVWRAGLLLTHLASGNTTTAVAEFEWFAHDRFSRVRRDMFWFSAMCVLAETCSVLRDVARAQELYELLEPYKDRNVQVTQAACWGSAERFLGLLAAASGRHELADAHLTSAIAKNLACGNPAAAAIVCRDLARLLLARGGADDLERAGVLLGELLRAARATGRQALIERIEADVEAVEQARRALVK
jgi:DNA-binding SARP family transcriptional activator